MIPLPEIPTPDAVADAGIRALARHYGTPEAEVTETLADAADGGLRSRVLLENVAMALIAALSTLNDFGFDDAAVTAVENQEEGTE